MRFAFCAHLFAIFAARLREAALVGLVYMQILFKIQYWTNWGESLSLCLAGKKYPMEWGDGGIWSVSVKGCTAAMLKDYGYVVMRDGLVWRM